MKKHLGGLKMNLGGHEGARKDKQKSQGKKKGKKKIGSKGKKKKKGFFSKVFGSK